MTGGTPAGGSGVCPVCGGTGRVARVVEPERLAGWYPSYLGRPLPDEMVRRFFTAAVCERVCRRCRLRWYTPGELGDSAYYAELGRQYHWYYAGNERDWAWAADYLRGFDRPRVTDVGCGNGEFLHRLAAAGVPATGVEINAEAVAAARRAGLAVYTPDDLPADRPDVMCLFQTLEHVDDPVGFLRGYADRLVPRAILVSVPCADALLGRTSDPLSWPPHHRTAWTLDALRRVARQLGRRVDRVWYDGLTLDEFLDMQAREPTGRFWRLPRISDNWLGRTLFDACRRAGCRWALSRHSVMVAMV